MATVANSFTSSGPAGGNLEPEGQILARLREGEIFGVRAYLNNRMAKNKTEATEDALLLTLPVSEAERLLKAYPQFAYFIAPDGAADSVERGRWPGTTRTNKST